MAYHWSTHQLTEYLARVSSPQDPTAAMVVALEGAVEALDAEIGAVVREGDVLASLGFGAAGASAAFLAAVQQDLPDLSVGGGGRAFLVCGDLARAGASEPAGRRRLVVGRLGEGYSGEETQMLHGMARVLGLVLHNLEALQVERARHRLVETLLAIQRAISSRLPLKELFDSVTDGASGLLDRSPVALLLIDPAAPGALVPASLFGFEELDGTVLAAVDRVMSGDHAEPADPPDGSLPLVEPVLADGEIAGCLVAGVGSAGAHRREHARLLSVFAQQVGIALNDANALEAVRAAHHDAVTGLPNRALFLRLLDQVRRVAAGTGGDLCLLYVDLDRFKAVNDTFGHQAGDELLAEVARRMRGCMRPDDIAARLGGDEFAIVLSGGGVEVGQQLATRLVEALAQRFVVDGHGVFIGASVGIALLLPSHRDCADLMRDADAAMYSVKRSGRGSWAVFKPHMHGEVASRVAVPADGRRA